MNLAEMKIATGRMLVCLGNATAPLSVEDLVQAIAETYEKRHDNQTVQDSLSFLTSHGLIDNELRLTELGKAKFAEISEPSIRDTWAQKFFRKSNSPNVGPRAVAIPERVSRYPAQQALTVMR